MGDLSHEPGCAGEFYVDPPPDHVFRYRWAADLLAAAIASPQRGLFCPKMDGGVPHLAPVLDVGCGSGYGMKMLEAAGFQAAGIDRNPDVLPHCLGRGLHAPLIGQYPHPAILGPWFAITMFEVVEHDAEGMAMLAHACDTADIVLASVPYNEAPTSPSAAHGYHVLFNLTEKSFDWMPGARFHRPAEYPYTMLIEWRRHWPER